MTKNWKLLVILAASAVVGVTAIAFASDLISTNISAVSKLGVMNIAHNDDSCPPNACSIVLKTAGEGTSSEVIIVR